MHFIASFIIISLSVLFFSGIYAAEQVELVGSGTAPSLLVSTMLLYYFSTDDSTTINYKEEDYPIPVNKFLNGETDFYVATQIVNGSERTMGDCCHCDDITAIPIAVSGLTIIHSLGQWGASTAPLTITRENLVKVYQGNITNWNELNPSYPNAHINVFYTDCAGGTDNFSPGLGAFSSSWTQRCPNPFPYGNRTVNTVDMLSKIIQTPNSIGYMSYPVWRAGIEEPYRTNQQVQLINKAGFSLMPGTASFFAAATDFAPDIKSTIDGVAGDLVDASGPNSWPLSYFEYVVVRSRNSKCDKLHSLFSFLVWGLSAREVLAERLEPFGVARLPSLTLERSLARVNDFVCCTGLDTTRVVTRGTSFGHHTFEDIAFTYLSSSTQLQDTPTNSTDGLQQLLNNQIDASLSTVYPTDSKLLPIRFFAAGISCVANINGLTSNSFLRLDGNILASIFDGVITSWSHSSIIALNPDIASTLSAAGNIVLLPFSDIDTRTIFSTAMKSFYKEFSGNSLPGFESSGLPQTVLDNIASSISSIACLPFSKSLNYHPSTTYVSMANSFGTVMRTPTYQSVLSAMNDFSSSPSSLLINGPGQNSWPICAYAYLVINVENTRCVQMRAVAQLVVWLFTRADAQTYLENDDVSTPPSEVRHTEQERIIAVTCGGVSLSSNVKDIYGVGGTFPLLVYQSWPLFLAHQPDPVTLDPNVIVRVSYSTTDQDEKGNLYYGSALGEYFAKNYLTEFGATDVSTLIDPDYNLFKFPSLAGGISLIFNLGKITSLTLSRQLIVKIFSGEVRLWSDPEIAALNPLLPVLPSISIDLVYRSFPSGSTYILKKGLESFSSESAEWKYGVSEEPIFPVSSILNGTTSFDITLIVATHPYSIGYVEHSYAAFSKLPSCSIINKYGMTTLPNEQTITSAMADFPLSANNLVTDIVDGPGEYSYPLSSYTYVIINNSWTSCATSIRTLSFLYSSLTSLNSRSRAQSFGLIPLPLSSIALIEDHLRNITCEGSYHALPLIAKDCFDVIGGPAVKDACGQCGGRNTTCCLGTPEQIEANCFSCHFFEGRPDYLLNTYMCDGFLDCTGAEDDYDCKVSIVKTSIVLSVIAGVCIILCFLVGLDLFINRNERIFRENNVFFMMMILSGCIVGYATVFVLSQLTKLNNFVCGVQYWFFSVAFVLTFGSMIAKTYQVYMLHRQHSGDLSAYTNQAIVRYVAVAMLIEIVLLVIWTAFDRPIPVLRYNDPSSKLKEHLICGNEHFTIFAILLALYFGIILVVGVVLSFLSRDIDFEGNESRLIRKTIISAALLAVVILPILIALGSSFPFVRILLSNVALLLIATLIMVTYFWPKLHRFHFANGDGGSYNELSKGTRLQGPIDI